MDKPYLSMPNNAAPPEAMLRQWVADIAPRLNLLPDKPEEDAESTLRALWHKAAGNAMPVERARQTPLSPLVAGGLSALQRLIEQRLAGTPLAHLTGRQLFMGAEFRVGPGALIPRKETELLGHTALELLRTATLPMPKASLVIDLCTGAGNLACAIALHAPATQVIGSDISLEAVACAMENRRHLGLDQKLAFIAGDLLTAFNADTCRQAVPLIVCNPPYISNTKLPQLPDEIIGYEPSAAFDGGPLGVSILNRLVKESPAYLCDAGWLCCEVGLGQGEWLAKRFQRTNLYQQVRTIPDANGDIRVVAAQRN